MFDVIKSFQNNIYPLLAVRNYHLLTLIKILTLIKQITENQNILKPRESSNFVMIIQMVYWDVDEEVFIIWLTDYNWFIICYGTVICAF